MGEKADESDEYRYERKFLVPRTAWDTVDSVVKRNPALFSPLYYPRDINNIYLDTIPLSYYFMNVEGVFDRTKVRIRWYGDLFGPVRKPVLEFKIKAGLLGKKASFPLAPFVMNTGFDADRLARMFQDSKLPDSIRALVGTLQPTLLNRYHRKYYQSADGHYRVTLDTNLEFYRLRPRQNSFLHHATERENHVLEMKYGSRHAAGAELAANAFPFRVGKISKYVLGLDFLDAC